jgi:two-component system NarL family sensor kinase
MLKKILIIVLLITTVNSFAQKNKHILDSIEHVIPNQSDSAKVKSYSELTWQYRSVNRVKAIYYGNKGISLAKKINYKEGLAQVYNDLGIIYYDIEKYDTAIHLYNEAMVIRRMLNDDLGIAKLYNKIGIIYQRQGKFSDALYNQQNALSLFEKTNYLIGISYSLNNIGILQQNLGRYNEALVYHTQSITIKEKLKDKAGLLQSYINIANIYKIKNENLKAEEYYLKAVLLARELENNEYLANGLNNLGNLQHRINKLQEGKQNILESYNLRTILNDSKGRVSSLNNLADILIDLKQYDSAKLVLTNAENLALISVNTKPELIMIYQTFSKLYEQTGNTTASLNYYKKHTAYKDSLYSNEMTNKFSELETKYHTAQKEKKIQEQQIALNKNLYDLSKQKLTLYQNKLEIAANELEIKNQNELILSQRFDSSNKEKQIALLHQEKKIDKLEIQNEQLKSNKKNILLIVATIITALTILLAFSGYKRYKLKKEKQIQQEIYNQKQISAQNILNAEENERRRIASDLHDGIGQLMSAAKMNLSAIQSAIPFATNDQELVYNKAINLVDESCKEIRTISHNMMPNALVKAGLDSALKAFIYQMDNSNLKINLYTEGLQNRLNANIETVLYRVIQECVNNVIKHAEATQLDISLIKEDEGIAAMIEDNGKGFDTTNKTTIGGIGLKNISTRIEFLNGTVEWKSAPEKGTLIAIYIPIKVQQIA